MSETCAVCGGAIPDKYGKHDVNAPVYTDEYVYHLGCEGAVLKEIYAEI